MEGNLKGIAREFEWSVAYGLTILAFSSDGKAGYGGPTKNDFIKIFKKISDWIKQFLP